MFQGKHVLLGVTGGIAAYKVVELASTLTRAGSLVDVVMTEAATRFVTPLTFQTITKRRVFLDMFEPWTETEMGHISLAERADVIVIAPATANTIAKLALGLADNMLTATALASRAPLIVAPAMDLHMHSHPATVENLEKLKARGATIVGPGHGRLASGLVGPGRLIEIDEILGTINVALGRSADLAGRKIVVTAGGTQEPLDPVRYVGNRSSGRMGYAIAGVAAGRGAGVTLITGAASVRPPVGAVVVRIQTALEMKEAVEREVADADALIMAAAVADYRPEEAAVQKIKKAGEALTLRLVPNPDILGQVAGTRALKVGFALETENMVGNARKKLAEKNLALIVANKPAESIGTETALVTFIDRAGSVEQLPPLPKEEIAQRILDRVVALLKV